MSPARPSRPAGPPRLVLFDSGCNLCHRALRFVVEHDPARRFVFAPLDSPLGRRWRERCRLPDDLDSLVLIEDDRCSVRGEALLRIMRGLEGVGMRRRLLELLPAGWLDRVYDLVARRRYGWFGRRDSCMLPEVSYRDRIVNDR